MWYDPHQAFGQCLPRVLEVEKGRIRADRAEAARRRHRDANYALKVGHPCHFVLAAPVAVLSGICRTAQFEAFDSGELLLTMSDVDVPGTGADNDGVVGDTFVPGAEYQPIGKAMTPSSGSQEG